MERTRNRRIPADLAEFSAGARVSYIVRNCGTRLGLVHLNQYEVISSDPMRVLATIEFLLIAALTVGAQTKPAPKRPAAPSKSASPSASAPSKSVPLKVAGQQCPIPRNELQQVYRLYMKDGSLQPVTECEFLDGGQRVHYKSAERGEWEDVPSS